MVQFLTYDIANFRGIITALGSTQGAVVQCLNYDYGVSKDGSAIYHGFITKYPSLSALGDTIAASATRGLHLFLPSVAGATSAYRYLQGFDDGTMRYRSPITGNWTTLNSGYSTGLPFDFEDYNYLDRTFWTNGRQAPRKWGRDWSAGQLLQDKSNTPTALTGTLTFTDSDTAVTGAATAFDTELASGAYIRKEATGDNEWWEVASVTDATNLVLVDNWSGSTGAGALGGSQKAATSTIRARFVVNWNDRLFWASGDNSLLPIVGLALVDDTTTPLP